MKSNRKLAFTLEAEDDLRAILTYSKQNWGEEQRNVYAARLSQATRDLLTHPDIGMARDDIFPGLRARIVGQHVIYYVVDEHAVTLIRVLHFRMDPTKRLRQGFR